MTMPPNRREQTLPTWLLFSFQINAKVEMSKMVINSEPASRPVGVKISTKTISLEEEFMCAPPQLYQVFTDKEVPALTFP